MQSPPKFLSNYTHAMQYVERQTERHDQNRTQQHLPSVKYMEYVPPTFEAHNNPLNDSSICGFCPLLGIGVCSYFLNLSSYNGLTFSK